MSDWRVIRTRRGQVKAVYGPFAEDVARFVAQRAAEKHLGDVVIVLPPKGGSVLRETNGHLEEETAA